MGANTGHYIKKPGRATAPASIVSVVIKRELDRELSDGPAVAQATLGEVYVSCSRRSRDRWTATEHHRFTSAQTFWAWYNGWTFAGRKTYVFSPTASDALTLLRFWEMVDAAGAVWDARDKTGRSVAQVAPGTDPFRFRRLVLKGSPDIIDYTVSGKSSSWCSARNYFHPDVQTLGIQSPEGRGLGGKPHRRHTTRPPDMWEEQSDAWLNVFRSLADWWVAHGAGGWAPTAGAMADRFLRSRLDDKAVCTHRNKDVQRLERLAAHRGRTSCWFYGPCVGPDSGDDYRMGVGHGPFPPLESSLTHIDVRSMYPYLLTTVRLPCELVRHRESPTVQWVKAMCEQFVCTASVRLNTPHAEYPHRAGATIDYPIGKFTSYLSGQELVRALRDGVVERVYECAVYRSGTPFARAARELLDMRKEARESGNLGWELFIKLLSNSMTGKLAQRRSRWVERPGYPPERRWGEWIESHAQTGVRRRFRALAGLVWEQVPDDGGTGTMTACYGHLTAACSIHMRRIRESLPERSVVSQDTDGLWCVPSAVQTLESQGFEFGDEPGSLRVTQTSEWSRFWGPKHYFAARGWKLAGLHEPVWAADGLVFLDTVTLNTIRSSPSGPPLAVADARRAVTLNALPSGGCVGADGWIVPATLPRSAASPVAVEDRDQCGNDRQNKDCVSLLDYIRGDVGDHSDADTPAEKD